MPTVIHRMTRWAEDSPNSPAQWVKTKSGWSPLTAKEHAERIYYMALYLESLGLTKEDGICIYSLNCPQWVQAELGMVLLGGRSAGLYPNSTTKELVHIIEHTEAKVLAVQNERFFKKLGVEPRFTEILQKIKKIIVLDGEASFSPKAIRFQDAIDQGRHRCLNHGTRSLKQFLEALDPHRGCFMIYTSGTTGTPKGALLSNDNLTFTSDMVSKHLELPVGGQSLFSFLPLCHVAEKIHNLGVGISQRQPVYYASRMEAVSIEMPEVRPTMLLSVPRLWEKMMETVLYKVKTAPPKKKMMVSWALEVGRQYAEKKFLGKTAFGERPSAWEHTQWVLANRLVLSKIRRQIGIDRLTKAVAGAAAMPVHVTKWFRSLGIDIIADFGQTESTGVICMTLPEAEVTGSVGKAVVGMEVKIASDGEILTRGRHVFKGYYKDSVATQMVLKNGWLHTGDLGMMTERGEVQIIGRKKEIIKTTNGKLISPQPIEEALKAAPLIGQVCMVGDGRKYLSVLVTLSENALKDFKEKMGQLDQEVIEHPELVKEVKRHIDELNRTLAGYEQIKRFAILNKEFSVESGEMTPTLKMKRSVIEARYQSVIERLYDVKSGKEAEAN